jgi:histidinol-phosphate aminotransferase
VIENGGRKTPLVRDDLKDLKPYEVPLLRTAVELDSNENPWNLSADVVDAIQAEIDGIDFNRYPDIGAARLRGGLAGALGVAPSNIMVGNGSNEVLLNLLLAFGGAGRRAMLFEPTYSMHGVLTRIAATETVISMLNDDFDFDPAIQLPAIAAADPSIVFLNSPNNPTGNMIPVETIEAVCQGGDYLVVVDEAYGEFAGQTCLPLTAKYKNLALVKTFSKAFRLAAARVGYVTADAAIIEALDKVKLPYNLNALSMTAAAVVWDNRAAVLAAVSEIVSERTRVLTALNGLPGINPYPTSANFVLFRTSTDADGIFDRLMAAGVQIRNFNGKPGLDNCLRVTIGTPAENDKFLAAIEIALRKSS